MVRDARKFAIGGGTAQMLRNQIAASILGMNARRLRRDGNEARTRRVVFVGGTSLSLQAPSSMVAGSLFPLPPLRAGSQAQSLNNRFRSGKSGSSLTKKFNRSQSCSSGHLPAHACRRGLSAWKCAQPRTALIWRGGKSDRSAEWSRDTRWRFLDEAATRFANGRGGSSRPGPTRPRPR
jgi:hypothetical protein